MMDKSVAAVKELVGTSSSGLSHRTKRSGRDGIHPPRPAPFSPTGRHCRMPHPTLTLTGGRGV